MLQFRYVARDASGKLVDGTLTCNDRAAAIHQVEQLRYTPIKIEPIGGGATGGTGKGSNPSPAKASPAKSDSGRQGPPSVSAGSVQTLSHGHQYLFTEQLAHLLTAGMTLDEALGVLEKRLKHPKLNSLSQGLHQALVDGRSLSQALRDYPRIFSPLYVNLVSAGEASGALADILKRLVAHLADVKGLRDRVQQALLYPAVLVVAGIGLIIVFMTVMVPKLLDFFKGSGQKLPPATQMLVNANNFLVSYWWAVLLGMAGLFMLFKAFTRSPEGRKAWDFFTWRIPLYSLIIRYRFYAQFARTLGTLVENGVTLLRSLELLEDVAGNEYVRARMVEVRKAVVDGATLSVALGEQRIFPELFVDMMAVGEQTGKFGSTMQLIADVYERELDKQIKIVSTLIPPLVMFVIAALVGVVVYAILSAVFGLTQGLRGGVR
jgi:type II secretory pathway component PulF